MTNFLVPFGWLNHLCSRRQDKASPSWPTSWVLPLALTNTSVLWIGGRTRASPYVTNGTVFVLRCAWIGRLEPHLLVTLRSRITFTIGPAVCSDFRTASTCMTDSCGLALVVLYSGLWSWNMLSGHKHLAPVPFSKLPLTIPISCPLTNIIFFYWRLSPCKAGLVKAPACAR